MLRATAASAASAGSGLRAALRRPFLTRGLAFKILASDPIDPICAQLLVSGGGAVLLQAALLPALPAGQPSPVRRPPLMHSLRAHTPHLTVPSLRLLAAWRSLWLPRPPTPQRPC
jgi:hypothetical protein